MDTNVNKKSVFTSFVALLLLIITIIGITYAYFLTNITGNGSSQSVKVTAGKLELTFFDGTSNINVSNVVPNSLLESKTFSIKNTGTEDIKTYEVYLKDLINELDVSYQDLLFDLTCVSDQGECKGSTGIFPKVDNTVLVTNSIKSGETQSFTLKINYIDSGEDQSKDMNKNIRATVAIKDDVPEYQEQ